MKTRDMLLRKFFRANLAMVTSDKDVDEVIEQYVAVAASSSVRGGAVLKLLLRQLSRAQKEVEGVR